MRHTLLPASLLVLVHSALATAQEVHTQWAPLEKSMATLLNEGWRITSYTQSRVAIATAGAVEFSFILTKESKAVICLIDSPEPNNAASRCRALN